MHYSDIKRKYIFKAEDDWGCYDENGGYHRGHLNNDGYILHSWWCTDGKQHQLLEHRMKWEYFNGKIPNNIEVDHIVPISDGGTNKLSNLRLCSHKENMNNFISVKKMSTAKKGKPMLKQVRTALYEASIKKVLEKKLDGTEIVYTSATEAARKCGFNNKSISQAARGKFGKQGHLYKNSNWYYL